jgi:hypothetical protein
MKNISESLDQSSFVESCRFSSAKIAVKRENCTIGDTTVSQLSVLIIRIRLMKVIFEKGDQSWLIEVK